MIRFSGVVRYGPFNGGRWRYGVASSNMVISCDEPGCAATVVPVGLEHNGAHLEDIYLPKDAREWRLGERDLCPAHAPPDEEEVEE